MFVLPSFLVVLLVVAKTEGVVVAQTVQVLNGGNNGQWGLREFCPDGSFAIGFNLKMQTSDQGICDDYTALNGIRLQCKALDSPRGQGIAGTPTSAVASWGNWVGQVQCHGPGILQGYLTAFKLKVAPPGSHNDETAANYIEFKCRDFHGVSQPYSLDNTSSHGERGRFGSWSHTCPVGSAICGIQTRVQKAARGGWHQDETALNNVKFFCCYG